MTVYQWLCLLGVPALIAAIFKYLHSLVKKNALDTAAVKAGLQALLRSQMISDYNKWEDRGFAPIYARENFEYKGCRFDFQHIQGFRYYRLPLCTVLT